MRPSIASLLMLLSLAACGGGGAAGNGSLAGTWILDVPATFGASAPATVAERFGIDAYRLDLRSDGTYLLRLRQGEDALDVQGTWTEGPDGARVSAASGEDLLRSEGSALVLEGAAGRRIVLARAS